MAVTVYPTGTTIYDPDRCWNGFTVLSTMGAEARLIDMNGNAAHTWEGLGGFPNKVLPGGYLMGSTGMRNKRCSFQDERDLVQADWAGNVVWRFNHHEFITDPGEQPQWMARQHHDYQREGNPVGYYVPGMEPLVDRGNTLLLTHRNTKNAAISDKPLLDDVIIEVDWEGHIVWQWAVSDHYEELGFSKLARRTLARNPNILNIGDGVGDWMHMNSVSTLGPNRWFQAGDGRFHPDNLVWSSRQSNILAMVEKKTGRIVWKLGPDFRDRASRTLGQIIGPHHVHMVPRGLPGDGNILVFDNGGWAGYGGPNSGSRNGVNNALRDTSRVLEFDPVSLTIVWQYTAREAGFIVPIYAHRFYSSLVSSAQRLPNGNTLITEGVDGRVFEITKEHELVWEYVNPHQTQEHGNLVYRSYRLPYEWAPQAERNKETPIHRPDNGRLRVSQSDATALMATESTTRAAAGPGIDFCVLPKS